MRFICLLLALGTAPAAIGLGSVENAEAIVDLNAEPLYVVPGFSEELLSSSLPPEGTFQRFDPGTGLTGRVARFIDLDEIGGRRPRHFTFRHPDPVEFTYLIEFDLREDSLLLGPRSDGAAPEIPGLFLAAVGDNWQIYLNGTLVSQAWFRGPDGEILSHRNYRDEAIPLDPAVLRVGTNLLAIRFAGMPTLSPTGFHVSRPYYLASYRAILRGSSEILPVAFIGTYFFSGIYHLFVYALRRRERYNLYFALFMLMVGLYLLSRTRVIYSVIPDVFHVLRLELTSLFLLIPLIGAFFESMNRGNTTKLTRIYAVFCGLIAGLSLIAPVTAEQTALRPWQLTALLLAVYYIFYELFATFFSRSRARYRSLLEREEPTSPGRVFLQDLGTTPTGNLLIGGLILFLTAVFDILDAMIFHSDLVLSRYGFLVFSLGAVLILANRANALQRQLADSNTRLADQVVEVTAARDSATASERKYRSLFDGSSDAVALLTPDLRFVEGNPSARQLFGIRDGVMPYLHETIHGDEEIARPDREQLNRVHAELVRAGEAVEVGIRVSTSLGEPRLVTVRLEPIREREVLLRALKDERDPMVARFVASRERYAIESTFGAADEVCRRATANLSRYLDDEEASLLMVCLREMVINAIEHGSLQVTYDEKSVAQLEGRYVEFLRERQSEPEFAERKVEVEWKVNELGAVYRVTDEGPGFDHRKLIARAAGDVATALEHGRGIFMTINAFDEVRYNQSGNQVMLLKRFL